MGGAVIAPDADWATEDGDAEAVWGRDDVLWEVPAGFAAAGRT